MARVPLMPTSQSLSLRHTAASASGAISASAAERRKSLANGLGGHALQPKAAGGLLVARKLQEVVKDQLAFAAGVTGVDDLADVSALEQALDEVESRLGFLDGLESEMIGNDRKVCKAPLAALLVHLAGQAKFDQVTDRGGDHKIIVLKEVVLLWNFAESAGEVGGDTRLFSDNESFWHVIEFSQSGYQASCLTSFRISRASNVEETSWVGNPHLAMIVSMDVSSSPMDSCTERSDGRQIQLRQRAARDLVLWERAGRSRQEYPARL